MNKSSPISNYQFLIFNKTVQPTASCLDAIQGSRNIQRLSERMELRSQTLPRLVKYKETLKCGVKRTNWYAARALEAVDAVINSSIHSAASFAGRQVNALRGV